MLRSERRRGLSMAAGLGAALALGAIGRGQPPAPAPQPPLESVEARLREVREEVRKAADLLSPEQAYDVFKNLARGKTNHLLTRALGTPRGAPAVAGRDVPSFSQIPPAVQAQERVIERADFLPADFLEAGAIRQRAVGRVIFKAFHATPQGSFNPGMAWGTGFLISPSLLMTNNHVIDSADFARSKVRIQFNFQQDLLGGTKPTEEYDLDPDGFFRTNPALDYTIVRVKPRVEAAPTAADPLAVNRVPAGVRWGFVRVEPDALLFLPSEPGDPRQTLNIIQHPRGRMKEVAIHDNYIDGLTTDVVLYTTDTEPGSSGSPVFNSIWQLVALHHAGGEQVDGAWKNNEGIRMDRIARDLIENAPAEIRSELGL